MATYRRDQWIESFEGRLAILRPHLTVRVLGTLSGQAWAQFGATGVDPIEAARELSAAMDAQQKPAPPARRK